MNDDWGRLALNVVGTYLLNYDVVSIPGGNTDKRAGTLGNTIGSNFSHWKTLTSLRWA